MTRSIAGAFTTHLSLEATEIATCWRLVRVDGTTLYFTDHDRDIVFGGQTYRAHVGFARTAISSNLMFSVDNLDVVGITDDSYIAEADVRAGRYDAATVFVFLVVWSDPDTCGELKLRRGTLGEVSLTSQGYFVAELRGLTQLLTQNTLQIYGPACRADLGDAQCGFPIKPSVLTREADVEVGQFYRVETAVGVGFAVYEERIYEVTTAGTTAVSQPSYDTVIDNPTTDGTAVLTARNSFMRVATIAIVTNQRSFVMSADLDAYADGWFDNGGLTFETGDNTGITYEIKSWINSTRVLELWEPARLTVDVSTQVRLYAGCHKRVRQDCRDKFQIPSSLLFADGNAKNFRGEPYVPGKAIVAVGV